MQIHGFFRRPLYLTLIMAISLIFAGAQSVRSAQVYWQGCGTLHECVEPGGPMLIPDFPTEPFSVINCELMPPSEFLVQGNHVWIGGWIDTDLLSFCFGSIMIEGTSGLCTCCHARTGNVDGDYMERTDISDLSALIRYLYLGQASPTCLAAANCDGQTGIDIGDLTVLIDYLYISFAPTAPCQ